MVQCRMQCELRSPRLKLLTLYCYPFPASARASLLTPRWTLCRRPKYLKCLSIPLRVPPPAPSTLAPGTTRRIAVEPCIEPCSSRRSCSFTHYCLSPRPPPTAAHTSLAFSARPTASPRLTLLACASSLDQSRQCPRRVARRHPCAARRPQSVARVHTELQFLLKTQQDSHISRTNYRSNQATQVRPRQQSTAHTRTRTPRRKRHDGDSIAQGGRCYSASIDAPTSRHPTHSRVLSCHRNPTRTRQPDTHIQTHRLDRMATTLTCCWTFSSSSAASSSFARIASRRRFSDLLWILYPNTRGT